ncbi:MAG: hypothetical protein M3276_04875 [Actinomycetota bacterium]|nr:hypothetical protein [Actinomycetota bacterium]
MGKRDRRRRRQVAVDPKMKEALERQLERFRQKFGRDPGPGDPVFFDPDADQPLPIPPAKAEAAMVEAMEQADVDPALIYAYQHTGLVVTEANRHLLSAEDLAEWQEAVERVRAGATPGDDDAQGVDELEAGLFDDVEYPDDGLFENLGGLVTPRVLLYQHDARLWYASPHFDDPVALQDFLVRTILSSGPVTAEPLWTGMSSEGWPATAVGVTSLVERWDWYTSAYVCGYVDCLLEAALLDRIAEEAGDEPHESAWRWYLPGDSRYDDDPASWPG